MNNNVSKQIILSVLAIAVLVVSVVGISYALFSVALEGTENNSLTTGTIAMTYSEETAGISITNALPLSDNEGKVLTGTGNAFDFTVSATVSGVTDINYEIVAEKANEAEGNFLGDNDVRLYLEEESGSSYVPTTITATPKAFTPQGSVSALGSPAESMLLYKDTISNTTAEEVVHANDFRLRMWVSEETAIDSISRSYKIKVNVYANTSN